MHRLPIDLSKLPDLQILGKYDVNPHAYGYCSTCLTFFDYWRYGDTDFMCPDGCGTKLRQLTLIELAEALADCEEDGCFQEEFLHAVPLQPSLKERGDRTC
jgi:hypothetical protein